MKLLQTKVSDRNMWQETIICLGLFCELTLSKKVISAKDEEKYSAQQKKRNFILY